jgi:hypothetical protein
LSPWPRLSWLSWPYPSCVDVVPDRHQPSGLLRRGRQPPHDAACQGTSAVTTCRGRGRLQWKRARKVRLATALLGTCKLSVSAKVVMSPPSRTLIRDYVRFSYSMASEVKWIKVRWICFFFQCDLPCYASVYDGYCVAGELVLSESASQLSATSGSRC